MSDNKEYIVRAQEQGSVKISEEVLASIAGITALEIEGVDGLATGIANLLSKKSPSRGIKVAFEGEKVVADIYLMVKYGYPLPEIAKKVQQSVVSAIESMTGLSVASVNVHITSVAFPKTDKKSKQ